MDGSVPTVIYGQESIREILDDLYRRGIQSLLVEGGTRLLQSFIDEGLWDEARTETAPVCLRNGTKAPLLRDEEPVSRHDYGGQVIRLYRHVKPENVE